MLLSCHAMLAGITKHPEIALSDIEAHTIADAAQKVARHYDIGASQKAVDWGNLMMVLGAVYGPRLFAVSAKKKPAPKFNGVDPMHVGPQVVQLPVGSGEFAQ